MRNEWHWMRVKRHFRENGQEYALNLIAISLAAAVLLAVASVMHLTPG